MNSYDILLISAFACYTIAALVLGAVIYRSYQKTHELDERVKLLREYREGLFTFIMSRGHE